MPKARPNLESKIAAAALRLAARKNWGRLTLDDIAHTAKLSLAQTKKLFPERDDILPAIVRFIDAEIAAAVGKPDLKIPPRDRLFEVMMARMDALQSHRRAILGIMDDVRRNPGMIRRFLPAQAEAMRAMLKLAGLEQDGPREAIAIAGLLGIHALVLCRWRNDRSADMAGTMAVLDRSLRRVSSIAEIIFRRLP